MISLFCFVVCLCNLSWCDLIGLMLKPENVCYQFAPILLSFCNTKLMVLKFGVMIWAAAIAARPHIAAVLLVFCAGLGVFYHNLPSNASYTLTFKQLSERTEAFSAIEASADSQLTVFHYLPPGSVFRTGVNFLLFEHFRTVKKLQGYEIPDEAHYLIFSVAVLESIDQLSLGRKFRTDWSYLESVHLPENFQMLYADEMFRIYHRAGSREPG